LARLTTSTAVQADPAKLSESPLDNYVAFVGEQIGRVLRLIDRDQQFTVTKSVRSVVGEEAWNRGKADRRWKFSLNKDGFREMCNVRLRGVLASAEWTGRDGLLELTLRPPAKAVNISDSGSERAVDQSHLPPCYIGNVGTRNSVRPSDAGGAQVFYNASPLGEWALEVSSITSRNQSLEEIDDIYLTLQLVVQSAP